MQAYGVDGDIGRVSSPMNTALSLFRQIVIYSPDTAPRPMTIFTNGKFTIAAGDRFSDHIGSCRMPIAWLFDENAYEEVRDTVLEPICQRMKEVFKFKLGNSSALSNGSQTMDDVLFETSSMIPKEEMIMYRDRRKLTIGADRSWFTLQCSELQDYIQKLFRKWKINPTPYPIGIGFAANEGDNWNLKNRPNQYIKVGVEHLIKVSPTTQDVAPATSRYQALYSYLSAYLMKEFMDKAVKNYEIEDYVCTTNMVKAGISGFGETPTIQHFTSTDEQTTLDHTIGFNYSMANRFGWGLDKSGIIKDDWEKYFRYCLALGYDTKNSKVDTQDYELTRVAGEWSSAWKKFTRATQSNFPSFGNFGNLVLLMSRNNFRYNGTTDIPLPTYVKSPTVTGKLSKQDLLKMANEYDIITPHKPVGFEQVAIQMGRFPLNFIDYTSLNQRWIIMKPMNDAQIIETDHMERQTIRWTFDLSEMVYTGLSSNKRKLLWLIGLLSNGESVLTEGYIHDTGISVFEPLAIRYWTNSFGELGVLKSNTGTTGDQQLKPGTLPTTPSETRNPGNDDKALEHDIRPPPPETPPAEVNVTQVPATGKIETTIKEKDVPK